MIYIAKLSQGVDGFRKINLVHGLNKIEEGSDINDFLNLPQVKKRINSGEYVIETEKDAIAAVELVSEEKPEPKPKRKKSRKKQKEENGDV